MLLTNIKTMVAAVGLMLAASVVTSQTLPTISSRQGPLNIYETVTIIGENFGANGPTVSIFADFEEGTADGPIPTTPNSATWGEWDYNLNQNGTVMYAGDYYHSGTLSFTQDMSIRGTNLDDSYLAAYAGDGSGGVREFLISWWMFLPSDSVIGNTNWKHVWVQGIPRTEAPDITLPTIFSLDSERGLINNNAAGWSEAVDTGFSPGKWVRHMAWCKANTNTETDDAVVNWWYMSAVSPMTFNPVSSINNLMDTGQVWGDWRFGDYGVGDPMKPHYDDIYLALGDYSRARVEIGDNATYTSCNNMTIMRPTSWGDGTIGAVFYPGSFVAGDTEAYIFVTTADGDRNVQGFQVEIGSDGSVPDEITASPTNLTASGGN